MLNKDVTTIIKLTLHSLKTQILNRDILTKKCQTQSKKKTASDSWTTRKPEDYEIS